jgi:hypothetical protein
VLQQKSADLFLNIEIINICYIKHSEASQMNRVAAKNRAKKCAAEMYFISDSWIPEILRLTVASPTSQRFSGVANVFKMDLFGLKAKTSQG